MIGIIDSGLGNVASLANMYKRLGVPSATCSTPDEVERADRLILPGVGAFDYGMESLHARGLVDALHGAVLDQRKPVLGVCLGMQLLARASEEGRSSGLGWIDASVVRFNFDAVTVKPPVPHMGWNFATPATDASLFEDSEAKPRFYFVHSYHVVCDRPEDIAATAEYGYPFVAAVQRDNIFGVQFHPEKSHKFGMRVLRRFAETEADTLIAPPSPPMGAAPRMAS